MTKNSAVLAGFLAASVIFAPQVKAQTPTSTLERVSSFEYDANGLLTREVVEPDRPNDCLRTDYAHDAYGNRTSVTSQACAGATGSTVLSAATPRATTTAFAAQAITIEGVSYASPAGLFATTSSNALSQTETKEYDPRHGGMTRLQGPNGGVTTWTYDAFGRKTRESRADGTYTLWSYKLCSAPEQAADALCTVQVGAPCRSLVRERVEPRHNQCSACASQAPTPRRAGSGRACSDEGFPRSGGGAGHPLQQPGPSQPEVPFCIEFLAAHRTGQRSPTTHWGVPRRRQDLTGMAARPPPCSLTTVS